MEKKTDVVEQWLSALTLPEKTALVAGHNFMYTVAVPRLGIPALRFSDGPHGLRVQQEGGDNGVSGSAPATCFPTASCTANTWNPELLKRMGRAIAEESCHYGIHVVLGPGVNIKRSPLCGRNFEYFSEDPLLAGELGAAEVQGIQGEGVGVSLKHFAGNGAENFRFLGDSCIDMRALREIYLRQFERIVKKAKPETLMCAYNGINGTYCCENPWLLTDVLRNEWGFKGLVMSDWGATHDRLAGIRSGLDLEMPGDTAICRKWIIDAVSAGALAEKDLNACVRNVLNLVAKHKDDSSGSPVDWDAHHALAKDIALEGAVLLKNDGAFPLSQDEKILVLGEFFSAMRYQGAGSSMINPHQLTTPKDAFDAHGVSYDYRPGFATSKDADQEALLQEALTCASGYDKVLLFLGLDDYAESEGVDREGMALPESQLRLVDALLKADKKIRVVLFGGSTIELPFYEQTDAILNMFLSGQNGGEACYELLFGLVSPSGRLAETWTLVYNDVPFGASYSKNAQEVYRESIYVGYRYYVSANKPVRFPFGYGLSYAKFQYENLKVESKKDRLIVTVDVSNVGKVEGKETVEVFVRSPALTHHPLRELKGFTKVSLKPGETISAEVEIPFSDLTYWDFKGSRFVLEDGNYVIEVCKDAATPLLEETMHIAGEKTEVLHQKPYEELDLESIDNATYSTLWNLSIKPLPPRHPITLESRFDDLNTTLLGKILYNAVLAVTRKDLRKARKLPPGIERDNRIKGSYFMHRIIVSNSLNSLSMSAGNSFPYNLALGFRELSNGHIIQAIKHFAIKIKAPAIPEQKEAE